MKKRSKKWRLFARLLKAERGCKCEECGYDKSKRFLHVHHIIPWSEKKTRYSKDNLIVLCLWCHIKRHKNLEGLMLGGYNRWLKKKEKAGSRARSKKIDS